MSEHCTKCGCEIHGFLTGRKYIDKKVHCSECYYDELGRVVEEHPIGVPMIDPYDWLKLMQYIGFDPEDRKQRAAKNRIKRKDYGKRVAPNTE